MSPYREDVREMALRLKIKLPELDEEGRLVRPISEGDAEDIAAEETEWKDSDL